MLCNHTNRKIMSKQFIPLNQVPQFFKLNSFTILWYALFKEFCSKTYFKITINYHMGIDMGMLEKTIIPYIKCLHILSECVTNVLFTWKILYIISFSVIVAPQQCICGSLYNFGG